MFPVFGRDGFLLLAVASYFTSVAFAQTTVDSTLLVIASNSDNLNTASTALRGYGIPYETVLSSASLPALNTSSTAGKYGGFIYEGTGLSATQLQQIYSYQTAFGTRMVRYNVNPVSDNFGTALVADGCCNDGVEQLVSFTNTSSFQFAGLKTHAGITTKGLWHYPGRITDPSIAWEIAQYGAGGPFTAPSTAAVVNKIGSREQMVWFLPFEAAWSQTSNLLEHSWVHYLTRSLYTGYRRVNFLNQVDDVFLGTNLYFPSGQSFRTRAGDMAAHVSWQSALQAKMNTGSRFFIELAHNGNGNIINGSSSNSNTCAPGSVVWAVTPPLTETEFRKPLGTGLQIWPSTPTTYVWSKACNDLDPLEQWFLNAANRNAFGHLTHTFTHIYLNNATYDDTAKEIKINRDWMDAIGISSAPLFSGKGIVPPAITGLHNGDALKAWADNGLTSCVGDNSRTALLNPQNEHWPQRTTSSADGYDGFNIIPRWSSNIYFNCDKPACIEAEYTAVSGSSATFAAIMDIERTTTTRYLFQLRRDPYMFHQANMRQVDMGTISGGGVSGQFSLLQLWSEVVVKEFTTYVNWPMITLKHDDIAAAFIARRARDACKPKLSYVLNAAGSAIEAVTVSAGTGSCSSPIPVTLPGPFADTQGSTSEQIGNDPLTLWVDLSGGGSKTFSLTSPVPVHANGANGTVSSSTSSRASTSTGTTPTASTRPSSIATSVRSSSASTTVAPLVSSIRPSSTSPRPSSTTPPASQQTICAQSGWDKNNPTAFFYNDSGTYNTPAKCKAQCITTQKATSFAQGGKVCLCYKARVDGNFTPGSGSSNKFYDGECKV